MLTGKDQKSVIIVGVLKITQIDFQIEFLSQVKIGHYHTLMKL